MTEITSRRKSNAERSAQMRQKLVDTARALFVSDGYAQTSTPDIVKAADVTRGALYHHFADKKDLFLAVIRQENEAVAKEIEDAANTSSDGIDMLMEGASAYFDAMQRPGRCRLLLLDGPSVLGYEVMQQIDAEFSAKSLKEGLTAAEGMSQPDAFRADLLSPILAAAFDRAALLIQNGADKNEILKIFQVLVGAFLIRR